MGFDQSDHPQNGFHFPARVSWGYIRHPKWEPFSRFECYDSQDTEDAEEILADALELLWGDVSRKKNVVCVNVRHDPRSFGPIKLAAPPLVI